MSEASSDFTVEDLRVSVFGSVAELGEAAAASTAAVLADAVGRKGSARVIFATGNSQLQFVAALRERSGIRWEKITVFHMDEYAGMSADHPASFRRWIHERVEEPFGPKEVHYIKGDAKDPKAECRRYEDLLREAPVDLVCMGIGENGHLAFNDPPVADFEDTSWVKLVELDGACRNQQVGEGHFGSLDEVPTHAITLTIPALLAPGALQVVVPERRKAAAVNKALNDPISTSCPASILRRQAHAKLFLDTDAASLLGSERQRT